MKDINVAYIVGGFPSKTDPAKGVFNFRAVKGLQKVANVTVFVIQGWKPGRIIWQKEHYEGVEVHRISLLKIPPKHSLIERFNEWSIRFFSYLILRNTLKNFNVIHSVFLTYSSLIGIFWKKKLKHNVIHIGHSIGSDVNSQMPDYLKIYSEEQWWKHLDGIICESYALKNRLAELLPNTNPVEVMYRGIDTQKYNHIQTNQKYKDFKVLFMGGFSSYSALKYQQNTKGGLTLMKAWSKLDQNGEVSNIKLQLGGPDSNSDFVLNWISTLKHPENVEVVGYVTPQRVAELINKAAVLLIPSMEEGLPNILLEASLLKTPSIASKVGGIPEVIEDEASGFLIEPGDAEALKDKIIHLKTNVNLAEAGQLAYTRILQYFDAANYPQQVLDFYHQLFKD